MAVPASSSSETPRPLVGLSVASLKALMSEWGQPAYRATQVYKWVHHHQVRDFQEMTNLSKELRTRLADHFILENLRLKTRQISSDGTRKYLWTIPSGHDIESVFIPEEKRTTICISSQVGCALGCSFCATARMGFLQNLTTGEIVEQIIRVQQDTGVKITNVVLMGMGEPFLNYPRVIDACKIMSDPEGLAIAAKKVTISTVGIVPRIRQFSEEDQPFSLAISLHAPTQALRQSIMPVADKFSLEELMDSAREYTRITRKRITFEYVLLAGVNDNLRQARELLKLLSPLKCKLNLIPYNDTGLGYDLPAQERQATFLEALSRAPFTVTLRKNRGNDIAAACGQLYAKSREDEQPRFIAQPPDARAPQIL
ncbi:MAG TPA: 23S rRNA (adenine(2503)-C(2))-methyltransferase RlmN [Calditrichia bacterium]|nr:23S rRNA (adenine(2503)-C(2))-methyltransferase RlmN [Calditrichota bacterium]HQU72137.1 23S rRNA (adenine(2503)-C(2))-methyltransferase RlmN [Calditrichia bacterium]HQV34154.1 23S rRNA (adenine(2503)-C(2))-methyltransferase RlmN [Calditrichia bacterium]